MVFPLSNCKENQFSTSLHIQTSLSISRPPTSINRNVTSTQKLPFQQNIVYIPPKSYLEQLTSFPQTTLTPAAGSINLHPTINQINTTISEHDLNENGNRSDCTSASTVVSSQSVEMLQL